MKAPRTLHPSRSLAEQLREVNAKKNNVRESVIVNVSKRPIDERVALSVGKGMVWSRFGLEYDSVR
jgi:hypothetical protein